MRFGPGLSPSTDLTGAGRLLARRFTHVAGKLVPAVGQAPQFHPMGISLVRLPYTSLCHSLTLLCLLSQRTRESHSAPSQIPAWPHGGVNDHCPRAQVLLNVEAVIVTLCGEMFVALIKLKIWRCQDVSGSCSGVLTAVRGRPRVTGCGGRGGGWRVERCGHQLSIAGRRPEPDSSLEVLEDTWPGQHLDFGPMMLILNFCLPEL